MENLGITNGWVVFLLIIFLIWTVFWKGIALWKAARRSDTGWFVILLIVNTLGILEIIYIFFFGKDNDEKQKNDSNLEEFSKSEDENSQRNFFKEDARRSLVKIV